MTGQETFPTGDKLVLGGGLSIWPATLDKQFFLDIAFILRPGQFGNALFRKQVGRMLR